MIDILSPGRAKILPAKDRVEESGILAKTIFSYPRLDSLTNGDKNINSPFFILGAMEESVNRWGNKMKVREK